jgi:hypothetical protein
VFPTNKTADREKSLSRVFFVIMGTADREKSLSRVFFVIISNNTADGEKSLSRVFFVLKVRGNYVTSDGLYNVTKSSCDTSWLVRPTDEFLYLCFRH